MKTRVTFLALAVLSISSILYCQHMSAHYYNLAMSHPVTTMASIDERNSAAYLMTDYSWGLFISFFVMIVSVIGLIISSARAIIKRKRRNPRERGSAS